MGIPWVEIQEFHLPREPKYNINFISKEYLNTLLAPPAFASAIANWWPWQCNFWVSNHLQPRVSGDRLVIVIQSSGPNPGIPGNHIWLPHSWYGYEKFCNNSYEKYGSKDMAFTVPAGVSSVEIWLPNTSTSCWSPGTMDRWRTCSNGNDYKWCFF